MNEANQITSADVVGMAELHAQALHIKSEMQGSYANAIRGLAIAVETLKEAQAMLVNRPVEAAKLHKITCDLEPLLRNCQRIVEADQVMLRR